MLCYMKATAGSIGLKGSNTLGTMRGFGARRSLSSKKLRILISEDHDPFFNLATEEWLFRTGDVTCNTMFLWRNEPTIVIGRCQNPWKECNIQKMNDKGVHLTRRYSGGGTVYQDLGNTNFTFLSSTTNFDSKKNSQVIIEALKTFGLTATISGRNDIQVDGLKISGAAYKLAPPRVMRYEEDEDEDEDEDLEEYKALHHGTLMINVDLTALGSLLNPNKLKLQTWSDKITHESLSLALIDAFCAHHG
ncbi:hypothetical protein GUITHDRAFT_101692 [Guillardia theta CCMP2712]|uniref:BPL/LPL catalytic domain-containing protein n=1 Tax=Guillardia theta (strain CCMP2712) TaxID=905079 RepID=L1JWP5_GUITC|nr:hypothetical protein GUITHDRAFT_101692 [Guillardia theta CCMP2712]EKX52523.1 hypothetical protein GUITHDRAFT_101692 [Guillardia theta CCMP2712]|eukprot:XP_005839503.1 hypothetical protein GUITHDRAFT_101692 [Guillardia theta CCMP2712]